MTSWLPGFLLLGSSQYIRVGRESSICRDRLDQGRVVDVLVIIGPHGVRDMLTPDTSHLPAPPIMDHTTYQRYHIHLLSRRQFASASAGTSTGKSNNERRPSADKGLESIMSNHGYGPTGLWLIRGRGWRGLAS